MEQLNRRNSPRKVMIGTPCMYGNLNVWYVNSLVHTIKKGIELGIEITPIWLSFDALIQRVRNDTIDFAVNAGVDDLFWIDSDIEWEPDDFFKLLDYPVDVVGGTYRKKGDVEEYVVRHMPDPTSNNQELIEVLGLGTGFVRMSKKACQFLVDTSPKYYDEKDKREKSMVFNVVIETLLDPDTNSEKNILVSEDIHAFNTLTRGGFKVWLDRKVTCNHMGEYKFKGNFDEWQRAGAVISNVPTKPAVTRDHRLMTNMDLSATMQAPRALPKITKQL